MTGRRPSAPFSWGRPGRRGVVVGGAGLPPRSQPPRAQAEPALPPPQSGISSSGPGGGISPRGLSARPGDYRALPPTYIFPRWPPPRRAGMAAAGGAASRRGPGRPCPFSIEHILSSLPDRSPPARVTRPPQPASRQSPAEPGEPGTPEAVPCACCCCCSPRAAPRRSPEAAAGLGK
jgi:hypothetical protein